MKNLKIFIDGYNEQYQNLVIDGDFEDWSYLDEIRVLEDNKEDNYRDKDFYIWLAMFKKTLINE